MPTTIWSRSETRQWTILLFVASICVYAARVSLPISVTAVSKEYNWTKSETGVVLASFFWGYACTQFPAGYLADRYGGDNVLLLNTLGWSVITVGTPFLFSLAYRTAFPIAMLILARVALGFAQGFHFPSTASLCSSRLIASEKSRVFGIVTAGSHVGTVVCGSLGSIILERFGWRAVMYFIGTLGLTWVFVVRRLLGRRGQRRYSRLGLGGSHLKAEPLTMQEKIEQENLLNPLVKSTTANGHTGKSRSAQIHVRNSMIPMEFEEAELKEVQPSASLLSVASNSDYSVPWRKLLSQPPFWAAFVAHYCGANAFFTLFSWLPSYFHETFPEAQGWVFNTVPHAILAMTSLCAPAIATRMITAGYSVTCVRRTMECTSLGGIACCLVSVSTITSYKAALFVISMAMACRGLHHGGVSVNVNDFAPDHTGAVFGLMNLAGAIPGFVGTYLAGHILELTHSWNTVFALTAVQCVFGAFVYGTLSTGKQLI